MLLLAALSLFIVFSPLAQALRHAVFDGYQRLLPLERTTSPVILVLVDDAALARYGQWPWPRTRVAQIIERIGEHRPAAIGLDVLFPEPDRFSPAALAAELPLIETRAREALESMPSNDERLAEAMRGRGVVAGIAGQPQADPRFRRPPRAAPVVVAADASRDLVRYAGYIGNVDPVDAAADGHGLINAGPGDRVVRMVPLLAYVQGVLVPALGLESLRVAMDVGLRLRPRDYGVLALAFGDAVTLLQDDGRAWLRFSPSATRPMVSVADVMAGNVPPDLLRDKVVLLGVSGLGLQDHKTTPLGEFVPGVHVHAQVVENLYEGVWLVRPSYAPWAEAALLLACGLVLIAFVPRLSALRGINLALGLLLSLVAIGFFAFAKFSVLLDPAWPAIGVAAVFGAVVVGTLSEAEKHRRLLREQAAHMAGEVDAARRIQMGLLPDPGETLAHDRRFRLAADLEPARTVGGDFYDCFMVDARRLFFVVADVSGKGLAAALFMAAAKSQIKAAALREPSVGEALTRAQDEIGRENPEQLFVTAFAGCLDVQTGLLEYANAGHEPPLRRRREGLPERLGPPGGPPLCVVEDFDYPTERLQLQPGEWLCLVTDGATEAMNPSREFFGLERLRASLSWLPEDAAPADVVRRVREDVQRFADGAEAADDITLMALRWNGPNR